MGPQRTARHLVSTRHHPHQFPELRRHSMLTRSMARAQPAPTSTSSDPPFEHLQRHSSQEVSDPSFLANSASHSHVTHGHFQEASGSSSVLNANSFSSREAPDPHSLLDTTSSDSLLDVLNTLGELPSKPSVPSELLTNFDQSFVMDLEMFNTRSRRLFDEQKKSLEFTKLHIDILAHQCTDLRAISHLRQGIQRLEHCCSFCKDLAWSPHPVDTPLAQVVSTMSDNASSSLTGYSNVQYRRFSILLDVVCPQSHICHDLSDIPALQAGAVPLLPTFYKKTSLEPFENPGAPGNATANGVNFDANLVLFESGLIVGGRFEINRVSFVPPTVILLQILSGATTADWYLEAGFAIVFAEDAPDVAAVNPVPENQLCPTYDALTPVLQITVIARIYLQASPFI
ncbi:uncharacterized protein C8R40DRAFT_1172478 [Lentinula edodes]|uniref:uncharacterized protein n=1 Tax=Lentinula edodes TaxID=5353 RepID=UPI001E8E70EA|nr:uncharacterized protein C8R40DRAFT_1172478 [Lentinula edodes]KAH7873682.1 hypothetical protein C8R40DRAFT_1172478 [Lentinula edodes]